MMKQMMLIVGATSVSSLLAVYAYMTHSISLVACCYIPPAVFLLISGFTVLRYRNQHSNFGLDKSRKALSSLAVLFTISACLALVQALQEGWNIGNTIGSIGFVIIMSLIFYEKRRRAKLNSASQAMSSER